MVKITFFALMILCVVCLMLFATTTLTNGGQVYKTFATHPDTPPSGGLLLWAKTDGTFQTTNSVGTDAGMGGGGGGGAGPMVSAYIVTVPADSAATVFSVVSFDGTDFDTSGGAMHSNTTFPSHLIAPSTGYYSASCGMIMVATSTMFIKLRLQGTTDVLGSGVGGISGANGSYWRSTTYLHMNANEYIECMFNPASPDHPLTGNTTWTGANFQLLKVF